MALIISILIVLGVISSPNEYNSTIFDQNELLLKNEINNPDILEM